MSEIDFYLLHRQEIEECIQCLPHDVLDDAACRGLGPAAYHPEVGRPRHEDLALCSTCDARVACTALALRAESPDARIGWYGGLDPGDRGRLAIRLGIVGGDRVEPVGAAEAMRLHRPGWTVNDIASEFGCSRRTVQCYLRRAG